MSQATTQQARDAVLIQLGEARGSINRPPPWADYTGVTVATAVPMTSGTAVSWVLDARTALERTLDELQAATRALAAALTDHALACTEPLA